MLRTTSLALLLVSVLATGAQSQTTSCGLACAVDSGSSNAAPTAASPKADGKKSDLDRVVCKAEDTTGSRLNAKKVCLTVAQWQDYENDAKDQTRRIQQTGLKSPE